MMSAPISSLVRAVRIRAQALMMQVVHTFLMAPQVRSSTHCSRQTKNRMVFSAIAFLEQEMSTLMGITMLLSAPWKGSAVEPTSSVGTPALGCIIWSHPTKNLEGTLGGQCPEQVMSTTMALMMS